MKEKNRRLLALVLAFVMAFCLSACGNGEKTDGENSSSAAAGQKEAAGKTASGAERASDEMRYAATFKKLDGSALKEYDYVSASGYTEAGFYGIAWDYTSGGDQMSLIFSDYDGNIRELSKYEEYIPEEDHSAQSNYMSDSYINTISIAPDGTPVVLESFYEYWNDDPEITQDSPEFWNSDYHYNERGFVRFLDADGAAKETLELPAGQDEYVSRIVVGEGVIYCVCSTKIKCLSQSGELLWEVDTGNYPDSFVRLNDGRLFFTSWGENGNAMYEINADTHEIGEPVKMSNMYGNFFTGGGDYDFYCTSGSYLYGYDIETGTSEKVLSWLDTDVSGDMYGDVFIAGDGTVRGFLSEYEGESTQQNYSVFEIKKVPVSSLKEKKTVTLATQSLGYEARNAVIKFNRSNEEYHIDVLDYSSYNTEEDYSVGLMKLQTEILSGNCPDIIDLNGLPVTRFASKGLLADLYEFIDTDPELKREDLFPSVLGAAECDGKLVSTVSGFYIQSLAGASEIVGDQPGWTYDDLAAALEKMPEGCEALSAYMTRKEILPVLLYLDMDHYVDWSTGACSFDTDEFKSMLKFASGFRTEYDWDTYDDTQDSDDKRIAAGQQMLANVSLYTVESVIYNNMYFGGKDITYVGYPTYSGSGNFFGFESGFAMSAMSKNKDVAWQFLRTLFTEEYQLKGYSLPSNIAAFDKIVEKAMTVEYEKDETGKYILDENGEKKPIARYSYGNGVTTLEVYALSQEQADTMRRLIETTTRAMRIDQSILEIVSEQAEAYFAGQKSLDEVARLIQSKASIYVNEQR